MNSLIKEILDPCQIEIIVRKGNATIKILSPASNNPNQEELLEIKSTTEDNAHVVLNLGVPKVGGTDNWGEDSDYVVLAYNKGAVHGDGILVDHIVLLNDGIGVDSNGNNVDWCKCEQINDDLVMYTALSTNNSTLPRTAYFKFKTESKLITRKAHELYGYEVYETWITTVQQEPDPELVEEASKTLVQKIAEVTKDAAIAAAEEVINTAAETVVISNKLRSLMIDEAINIATQTAKDEAKTAKDEAERAAQGSEESPEEAVENSIESAINSVKAAIQAEKTLNELKIEAAEAEQKKAERAAAKAKAKAEIAAKEAIRQAARNK